MNIGYKSESIAGREIFFDQTYYIAYAGGKRELPKDDQKAYSRIQQLPFMIAQKAIFNLPKEKNPNVIPLTGKQLLELIHDKMLVPVFDLYFERTRTLQISELAVYDMIKEQTYSRLNKALKQIVFK